MQNKAFMVMPFSDNIVKNAYDYVVKPVFEKLDIVIRKADEIWSVNPIYDDIITEIHKASLIVVDISGKNPNVFYELGIAHTLKREKTIILTHDEMSATPFDVSHFRIIQYSNSIESSKKLEQSLENTIKIILSDSFEEHLNEFHVVYELLMTGRFNIGVFADIIALDKNNDSIPKGYGFNYYYLKNNEMIPGGSIGNLDQNYKQYESIGYIESDKNYFYLTQKGKMFVRFIKEIKKVLDIDIELFESGY